MKNYFKLCLITVTAIFMLSACAETNSLNPQTENSVTTLFSQSAEVISDTSETSVTAAPAETAFPTQTTEKITVPEPTAEVTTTTTEAATTVTKTEATTVTTTAEATTVTTTTETKAATQEIIIEETTVKQVTVTVYIASSGRGTKYHRKSSCSNMKGVYELTVSEAQAQGYTACSKCY